MEDEVEYDSFEWYPHAVNGKDLQPEDRRTLVIGTS